MLRNLAFVVFVVFYLLATSAWAAEFGTAEEAKAMLERAVAAVKENKAKALDMFNNGEGGFKDRDLYVWCANASDGIITATPYWNRGKQLRDIEGKRGAPFGETVMQNATEGTIKETTYWWPRPGTDKPLEKTALYTKVGDQICSVGFWHLADNLSCLPECLLSEVKRTPFSQPDMSANDPKQTCSIVVRWGR